MTDYRDYDAGYSDVGACIVWQGPLQPNGYGRAPKAGGRTLYAHRQAYEDAVGPIPDGYDIDHLCRNRACVNPAHLEPVTRKVNLLRGETLVAAFAIRTHCKRGHELGGDNVPRYIKGRTRSCLACAKLRDAKRDHKAKRARHKEIRNAL